MRVTSVPRLRGGILAVDLVRACVRHDPADLHDVVVELDRGMRRLMDPAGGVALHDHARHRVEGLFADAVEALGCRPGDTTPLGAIPAVAVETTALTGRFPMPPDVGSALDAFAAGDVGPLGDLHGLDRFVAVSLATAAAERASSPPEAVLEKLDALRERLAAGAPAPSG
ncbi:hypothetical protein ACF08W_31450 [Streptomyces sp. NPDC015144]|uniref:hypothetical protein n=1 Tax=Streptomyces sp. NPDC015144 TaxID=3364944 RepID=UPI003702D382